MMGRVALFSAAAAGVFLLDQATKFWIVWRLGLETRLRIDVVPPFLNLRMAWNEGVNFGLPLAGPGVLIALSAAISAGLAWWALRRGGAALALGAGRTAGGAAGTALDRALYGAVADFLNMSCCGIDNPYAFNIADIAIFAGVAVIALKA